MSLIEWESLVTLTGVTQEGGKGLEPWSQTAGSKSILPRCVTLDRSFSMCLDFLPSKRGMLIVVRFIYIYSNVHLSSTEYTMRKP